MVDLYVILGFLYIVNLQSNFLLFTDLPKTNKFHRKKKLHVLAVRRKFNIRLTDRVQKLSKRDRH